MENTERLRTKINKLREKKRRKGGNLQKLLLNETFQLPEARLSDPKEVVNKELGKKSSTAIAKCSETVSMLQVKQQEVSSLKDKLRITKKQLKRKEVIHQKKRGDDKIKQQKLF